MNIINIIFQVIDTIILKAIMCGLEFSKCLESVKIYQNPINNCQSFWLARLEKLEMPGLGLDAEEGCVRRSSKIASWSQSGGGSRSKPEPLETAVEHSSKLLGTTTTDDCWCSTLSWTQLAAFARLAIHVNSHAYGIAYRWFGMHYFIIARHNWIWNVVILNTFINQLKHCCWCGQHLIIQCR